MVYIYRKYNIVIFDTVFFIVTLNQSIQDFCRNNRYRISQLNIYVLLYFNI